MFVESHADLHELPPYYRLYAQPPSGHCKERKKVRNCKSYECNAGTVKSSKSYQESNAHQTLRGAMVLRSWALSTSYERTPSAKITLSSQSAPYVNLKCSTHTEITHNRVSLVTFLCLAEEASA